MSLAGVSIIVTGKQSNSNLGETSSYSIIAIFITMLNPLSVAVVNIALR